MKRGERLVSVDLIRTLAIILVVGFHIIFNFNFDSSYRWIGFTGISLFMIVSGFLLAKKYPSHDKFSLKWFLSRAIKIIAIYYLALVMVAFLLGKQVYSGNVFLNLLSHFFFLDFVSVDFAYSFISSAWFLVPLVALYLLFPYINKYVSKGRGFLFLAFVVTIAARVTYDAYTSYNPVFFLAEFAFGIALAKGRKIEALVLSILTIFVMPEMVLPFLIFYFLLMIDEKYLPAKTLSFIGRNTIILFLFHESFLKVAIGRWHIFNLSTIGSLVVLLIFTTLVIYLSKKIESYLLNKRYFTKNKTLKNQNG